MAQKSCATPCDEIEKGGAAAQPLPRRSPSQTTGSSTMASPNRSRLRRGAGSPYLRRRSRTKTCCAMTLLALISSA